MSEYQYKRRYPKASVHRVILRDLFNLYNVPVSTIKVCVDLEEALVRHNAYKRHARLLKAKLRSWPRRVAKCPYYVTTTKIGRTIKVHRSA